MSSYTFSGRCYTKSGNIEKYESDKGGTLTWNVTTSKKTDNNGVKLTYSQAPTESNNGNYLYDFTYNSSDVASGIKVNVSGNTNYADVIKSFNFSFTGNKSNDANYAIYIATYFPDISISPLQFSCQITPHGYDNRPVYSSNDTLTATSDDRYPYVNAKGRDSSGDWDMLVWKEATQAFDLSVTFYGDTQFDISSVSLGNIDVNNNPPCTVTYTLQKNVHYTLSREASEQQNISLDTIDGSLPYSLLSSKVSADGPIAIYIVFTPT